MPKIIYTLTDEAPALATRSLLPVVQAFVGTCGIEVETRDISLAARILAAFPDFLKDNQKQHDALAELGQLAKTPEANLIKLPNISASVPQAKATIAELQAKGYAIPDYPDDPENDAEADIKKRYAKVMGSAVNPVLREGNSDRRAPNAVKQYARSNPHSMGKWSADSKSHVAHMPDGDFVSNEKSTTFDAADDLKVQLVATDGTTTVLKESIPVLAGEVVDATAMDCGKLDKFLAEQIADAKAQGILFSLHMKATMMKVSDPIIFGHAVKAYFQDVFDKHGDALEEACANVNNGLGNVLAAIGQLPEDQAKTILADIDAALENGPDLSLIHI